MINTFAEAAKTRKDNPSSGTVPCRACKKRQEIKKKMILQKSSIGLRSDNIISHIVNDVLKSSGYSLDAETKSQMDLRFNYDFSKVRIHTDAKAAESANMMNARAYTVGQNIVFGNGQYNPRTNKGLRLLAHELTHVLQTPNPGLDISTSFQVTSSKDPRENEARKIAESFGGMTAGTAQKPSMIVATNNTIFREEYERGVEGGVREPESASSQGEQAPQGSGERPANLGLACRNTCDATHRSAIRIAQETEDQQGLRRALAERDQCYQRCQEQIDRVPRPTYGRPGIWWILRNLFRRIFGH